MKSTVAFGYALLLIAAVTHLSWTWLNKGAMLQLSNQSDAVWDCLLILGQVRCLSLLCWLPCESHFNDYMHMYISVRPPCWLAVYKCKAMQSWNLNRNRFWFFHQSVFFSTFFPPSAALAYFSLSCRLLFLGFCICNFGPLGSQFQHPRCPISF